MNKTIIVLFVILFAAVIGCRHENSATAKAPEESMKSTAVNQTGPGKKGTLLFFMNPDGIPCRMQNEILNDTLSDIRETVDIQYVKTTNPSDRDYFYEYAIRGLPSMLIINADKKIIARFSPGIQNRQSIVAVVRGL